LKWFHSRKGIPLNETLVYQCAANDSVKIMTWLIDNEVFDWDMRKALKICMRNHSKKVYDTLWYYRRINW
jgi:hypothetical protein